MTCSVRPGDERQPHWQLAWRCPLPAGGGSVTTTLCPLTCSLTETIMGGSRVLITADRPIRPDGADPTATGSQHQIVLSSSMRHSRGTTGTRIAREQACPRTQQFRDEWRQSRSTLLAN